MKNLKNKDDLVNFNIFKLTVKNSLHLVWTPCTLFQLGSSLIPAAFTSIPCFVCFLNVKFLPLTSLRLDAST